MDKIEAVRIAMTELGEVAAEQLTAFVRQRFGVTIDPRFVPIFKATVRDREGMERARRVGAQVITQAQAGVVTADATKNA